MKMDASEGVIAGILTIGDEVLDGLVLDTNSNWIQVRLSEIGVELRRQASVRDELDGIGKALRFLQEDCNVIITSGGLGPTHDDMTLEAAALALDLKLEINQEALDIVDRQYKSLHKRKIVRSPEISESRKKMAMLPQGSTALNNSIGGAPGVKIKTNTATIFCLPGVPSELKAIWKESVGPWIASKATNKYYESIVEFRMRDESVFSPIIDIVMKKHPGVWIKSMPRTYGTTSVLRVWVSARGKDQTGIQTKVRDAVASLAEEAGLEAQYVERSSI
ncbi:MAG: competence/damage-inducible protein A [Candidatus Thorarchaeota archaeon]|jgi:molybdenum cofactor synthesis domain-containing protein